MKPTHIDFFSGIGGFALAAQWAGFETVAFCEIERYAQKILLQNFGAVMANSPGIGWQQNEPKIRRRKSHSHGSSQTVAYSMPAEQWRQQWKGKAPIYADIRKLHGEGLPRTDLLTAGYPCQPFSSAGKRGGQTDDRYLWPEVARILREMAAAGNLPDWCLFENVAGHINLGLDDVLSDLESIGYTVWPFVIPACAVDARHRRDRVWILANARSLGGNGRRRGSEICQQSRISNQIERPSEDASNSKSTGLEGPDPAGNLCTGGQSIKHGSWGWETVGWIPEPGICRVAHGIPHRVDRLKGLGNAIVPQVAYQIIKVIREEIP